MKCQFNKKLVCDSVPSVCDCYEECWPYWKLMYDQACDTLDTQRKESKGLTIAYDKKNDQLRRRNMQIKDLKIKVVKRNKLICTHCYKDVTPEQCMRCVCWDVI